MTSPRPVLLQIEAELEGGNENVDAMFEPIGLPENEEVEFIEIPGDWSQADRDFFHYVRGNYCLYRLSDSYLNTGIEDFEAAFPSLIAANDASRATRAFARTLRQLAYASYSLPSVFEKHAMVEKLDWMRKHAPREDVEELDLSLVEMITRMATGPFNERDAIISGYGIVRATLSRLFLHPPSRLRSVPYAAAGFWLDIDALWTDDDLAEVELLLGVTGRQELRREAYARALELEDGSFYKVGSHTGEDERRRTGRERHFGNLLTQYETLGDQAGLQAAIERWGEQLGPEAVEAALAQATENARTEGAAEEPSASAATTKAAPAKRKAPAKAVSKPKRPAVAKKPARPAKRAASTRKLAAFERLAAETRKLAKKPAAKGAARAATKTTKKPTRTAATSAKSGSRTRAKAPVKRTAKKAGPRSRR